MHIGVSGVLAALLVGAGLAALVVGVLLRSQRRSEQLAQVLDLVGGEYDVPVEAVTESPAAGSLSQVTVRLGEIFGRLDTRGSLEQMLSRAGIPLRPGEYLLLSGATVVLVGMAAGLASRSLFLAVPLAGVAALAARMYPARRGRKRRNALRAQLPDAFSLIASAVVSGHTFLRSIQLLREQIASPLAEELDTVVAEVMLGSNLVDSLQRMADRTAIDELRWAVQALRINQAFGGQLGELLHTLADFMRAREEVSREVQVLSAEGRLSAYVLIGLPIFVALIMQADAPHYLSPLFRGWGFAWLGLCGAMLFAGWIIIRRLVDIEV